jgi:hypothetical protein
MPISNKESFKKRPLMSVDNPKDPIQPKLPAETDAKLAESLKNAAILDEEARILRAEEKHADDDTIDADDQLQFLWFLTPEAIQAVKKRHPFIQVAQVYDEEDPEPEYKLKLFESESGWNVCDYGSAFATSRGEFGFGEGDFRIKFDADGEVDDDDGGEGDDALNPGKGTYINQAVQTAEELARLAVIRKWKAVQLYDADPLMAWAFWAEASYYGLAVFGYEPTAADIAKRNRTKLSRRDLEDAIKEKRDIAKLVL